MKVFSGAFLLLNESAKKALISAHKDNFSIPPLTEKGHREFPSVSTKFDWILCKQVATQSVTRVLEFDTRLANNANKFAAIILSAFKTIRNFFRMALFFVSNVAHFSNHLMIIKRMNWFCKRTVALRDEFSKFRNHWLPVNYSLLPFSLWSKNRSLIWSFIAIFYVI